MWRRAPAVKSVSIQPGRIALTWMLSSAQAIAHDFVIWTTPPLLAAYGIENGCPNRLVIDPMLTIVPPPPRFIGSYAACEQTNTAVRLVSITRSNSSTEYSSGRLRMPMPALLTRMCRPPCPSTAWATIRRTSSTFVTSTEQPAAAPARMALSSPTAASIFSWLRPATTTVAPHSTKPRAIPSPIPPLPPVTIATLPVRSNSAGPAIGSLLWNHQLAARLERLGEQVRARHHRREPGVDAGVDQQLGQLVLADPDVQRRREVRQRLAVAAERQQDPEGDQLARPLVQARAGEHIAPGVLEHEAL